MYFDIFKAIFIAVDSGYFRWPSDGDFGVGFESLGHRGKGTIEAPEKIFCACRISVTGKPAFQGYQRFYLLRRTEVSSLHGVYRPPVSILSQTPGVSIAFSST